MLAGIFVSLPLVFHAVKTWFLSREVVCPYGGDGVVEGIVGEELFIRLVRVVD